MEICVINLNKKISKINLKLKNIEFIVSDGSGFYVKRKKGRGTYFFDNWFLKEYVDKELNDEFLRNSYYIISVEESNKFLKFLKVYFENPKDILGDSVFFVKEKINE